MSFIKETVLSLGTKWLQSYNSTWLLSIQYKTLQIVSFNFYSKSQKQYFWLPTHTFWSPHSHFDLFMGGMSSKEFRWNAFQLNNTNNSQWNIPNRPITFFSPILHNFILPEHNSEYFSFQFEEIHFCTFVTCTNHNDTDLKYFYTFTCP